MLAGADTNVAQLSSTREVLAVFMEGNGHDSVGCVECFFDTVAMVDIDIDVEDALLETQQFEDAEDDVWKQLAGDPITSRKGCSSTVDIAETTGLALFGVVKTTGPVDCNVALLTIETGSTLHATTSADAAELKEAVKNGTIISDIVFALFLLIGVHVVGSDLLEEVDVLVCVELGHLSPCRRFRALRSLC